MAKAETISKFEAVRLALQELGKDTMPQAIVDHVKSKHGITMTTAHVSNYKGKILRGGKKKRGRPRKEVAAAESTGGQEGHGRTNNARSASGISIADIEAVKALTERMGAEKLQALAKVLAQ